MYSTRSASGFGKRLAERVEYIQILSRLHLRRAQHRTGEADQTRPRRIGLDRDESARKGPQPALRDGERPGGGRATIRERRAGPSLPAERGISDEEVCAPASGAGHRG